MKNTRMIAFTEEPRPGDRRAKDYGLKIAEISKKFPGFEVKIGPQGNAASRKALRALIAKDLNARLEE